MDKIIKEIYECRDFLSDILKTSGFCTEILKKNNSWLSNKYTKYEFQTVKPGFQKEDIPFINSALKKTASLCLRTKIAILENDTQEKFSLRAAEKLKVLRKVVNINYMLEHYTHIKKETFGNKIRHAVSRGKIVYFTMNDIDEINYALGKMAELLNSIELILVEPANESSSAIRQGEIKKVIMSRMSCTVKGLTVFSGKDGTPMVKWSSMVSKEDEVEIPQEWTLLSVNMRTGKFKFIAKENDLL